MGFLDDPMGSIGNLLGVLWEPGWFCNDFRIVLGTILGSVLVKFSSLLEKGSSLLNAFKQNTWEGSASPKPHIVRQDFNQNSMFLFGVIR